MKKISCLLILFSLIFGSCSHDDIFSDNPYGTDEANFILNGDGGSADFSIPVSNLKSITILHNGEDGNTFTNYYMPWDNLASDKIPISEISRIVFDNDFSSLEIKKDGKKIQVKSISNATPNEVNYSIRFTYDSGVKTVTVKALPGKPLLLKTYALGEFSITDSIDVKTKYSPFDNKETTPLHTYNYPYSEEYFTISIDPLESSWLKDMPVSILVPTYMVGGWTSKKMNDVFAGQEYSGEYYMSDYLCIQIGIEPQLSGNIITEIAYSKAETLATMYFHNEILDRDIKAECKITSIFPIKHSMKIRYCDGSLLQIDPIPE